MHIRWICSLWLLFVFPLRAQISSPSFWKADPRNSHLEILTPLGGWDAEGSGEVLVKLVDPTDPRPPVNFTLEYWERWQDRRKEEEAALRLRTWQHFEGEPGLKTARREEILAWIKDWDSDQQPVSAEELSFASRWLKAETKARSEQEAAEESRTRSFQVWLNGEVMSWDLEVNRERHFSLKPVQGENRLEVLDPATGQHYVRTWWCGVNGPRLRVVARELGERWGSWDLEVLEPGGKLASHLQRFERSHPAQGTYTLRWNAGGASGWWSREDARPRILGVDVILDGGTDKERRWHFESLILPGTGIVLIGSFDVET